MKSIQAMRFLVLVSMLVAGALQAGSTNLLPGVTFYDGPEKLTGKLVFLLKHDPKVEENSETAASIYEYNFEQRKLGKVADAPSGLFLASHEGDTFCVTPGNGVRQFIYSEPLKLSRTLKLEGAAKMVVVMNGHVFFEIEGSGSVNPTNYASYYLETKILDYEISTGQLRQIKFPDASIWGRQDYDQISIQLTPTNCLCFNYATSGRRLADGKDYKNAAYCYDTQSGLFQRVADMVIKPEQAEFKTFDGSAVGFENNDGSLISEGFKLVNSSGKVLHRFSKLNAIFSGGMEYQFRQVSPDGRYALVSNGGISTYYVVDISTGKTRLLLDSPDPAYGRCLWGLYWVQ